jgi:RNA polymerase sigma factor for flagellar operon FliA
MASRPDTDDRRDGRIASCQGLVRNIAWQIHQRVRGFADLDDLIGYGQVGLAEAASRFDESHGTRFTTYAYHRIRGAIYDGLGQMGWFRRADYHAGRYERLADEVLDGLDPTGSADLAAEAGWFSDVSVRLSVVYLTSGLADTSPADTPTPAAEALLAELRGTLRELVSSLPDQARQLIQSIYFDGLTLTEAGARLNISKSWASRVHDRTLRQLAVGLRRLDMQRAT